MTPYEELHKKFKLTPQDGESFESFALRTTKRVNALSDAEWGQLSEGVQLWINEVLKARDAKQNIPKLEGYPNEEPAGADGEEASVEDVSTDAEETPDAPDTGEETTDSEDVVDAEANSGVDDAPEAEASGRRRVERAKPVRTSRKQTAARPETQKSKTGKGKDKTVSKTPKAAAAKKGSKPMQAASGDRINDDAKIKILVKENPHRSGTKLFGYFKKYKDGMTVAAAKKAGIPPKNIQYLQGLGSIKVIAA